ASNSLPVITIQKKHPVSENETVVLPQPQGENAEKAETTGAESGKKEEESEKEVSVSKVRTLSEVMEEISTDVAQKGVSAEESKETEKAREENIRGDKKEQMSETSEVDLRTGRKDGKRFLLAGVLIVIFIISGAAFFLFKDKKEEGTSAAALNIKVKDEKKTEVETGSGNKQQEGDKNIVNRSEQKSEALSQDIKSQDGIVKKREQKVAVAEKPKVQEKRPETDNKEIKTEEKPKEEVQTASVEVKKGFMSIDSDPWTEVYLDGKKLGETPLVRYELPAGVYNVVLKNSEFGFEKPLKVTVNQEENSINKVKLGKGFLTVTANVEAEVRLGGNIIGKTPITNMDLYEGIYRITIFDPVQKKSRTVKVEIKEGKTAVINENL
ncbi:MAG: PEGA domain-containing protein, partial [Deltaproteobacteria bacterium]|nr:PEGA domain-containing protein [Deltaproteobacteria bacterium]